jgi:pyruvate dehydrogenase complex dehydrogenase (E1) component
VPSRTASSRRRACNCSAPAPSSAKSSPPPNCSRTTGASTPTCGAARASTNWRAKATTSRAGTCSIRFEKPRQSHVEQCLNDTRGPIVAATDYVRQYAEQIRPFLNRRYVTLGTDGFGRSDTREALRHFFEVDRRWVTIAALKALADDEVIERSVVAEAIAKYGIDINKPNPMTV